MYVFKEPKLRRYGLPIKHNFISLKNKSQILPFLFKAHNQYLAKH